MKIKAHPGLKKSMKIKAHLDLKKSCLTRYINLLRMTKTSSYVSFVKLKLGCQSSQVNPYWLKVKLEYQGLARLARNQLKTRLAQKQYRTDPPFISKK